MSEQLSFNVNGQEQTVSVGRETSLLTALREGLDLTGAKIGCAEGQCGACTVLVDNQAVRSCITSARAAAGRHVRTIEGLAQDEQLHPLQQAFLDHDALQCGYCTPGMIMASLALLNDTPDPSAAEIVAALDGNICRCGTHDRIVQAVRQAAGELQAERSRP